MAFKREKAFAEASSSIAPLILPIKVPQKGSLQNREMLTVVPEESNVDLDLREVYFLIMHFLSAGPFRQTYTQLWEDLLEHQLLPRRFHAWYSRCGAQSGEEDDDGISVSLCYPELVERYRHIDKDHLVKLLKQLVMSSGQLHSMVGVGPPNAADVPTILGSGTFSLLSSDQCKELKTAKLPSYLRWPHMHADQVHGLSLREIGGGFTKHHRAPSVRAACYAIAKPSTLVQKMQIIKRLHGHQNAVYCATFDRSGRYVITGSDDRLVKIWSMETAFCLASCRGHEGDITDLAVSCNNTLVASSSNDFIIRVWRIPDGLPISVLKGHVGVVTAIAFSPRPSAAYQLLSSSDDGTCRIWDARFSQPSLRVYKPKPPEVAPGKNNDSVHIPVVQNHQITCCAFNSNGTVFVTGSSDSFARVWNACKGSTEESEQSLHEMDLLSGHENDVNYVQFSGCAVASRFSCSDSAKEDNIPKFKNSWFTHDCIVTCSRDGSAIIWVPRSRRSHGKVGRWTRAYHLKVPPPPMPPQPLRGGPRQRHQQTPRGVNMIVWSLDNRFVLAAIMDCRICVWNASDGSLVHSLIGHKESTFVLDVHPFNPRIAMSAGYDGKTIIWDIWEGKPVQIYETGQFKLVDGKFSPDGTSIVLSDEIGQIFIIATGQGESQKDAKYDQFFLGDYRPLIQDTNGNVLDQETQLQPHRRNMQDLLCDAGMLPYPEPYQSMYQKRRLGIIGIEWRPPSVNLAIGPTFDPNTGEFQTLQIIDPETWLEPLPEIPDVIEFDLDNEVQTDDADSEYNVTEECASEGELEVLSYSSSYSESNAEDNTADPENASSLRRSKRKKHRSDAQLVTSSGRRVKRRVVDENHGSTKVHKFKKPSGRFPPKRNSHKSKGVRPQRRAARNALDWLSKIKHGGSTDEEDDYESESSYSESEILLSEMNDQSAESLQNALLVEKWSEESRQEDPGFAEKSSLPVQSVRKLVLKIPRHNAKALFSSENAPGQSSPQKVQTAEPKKDIHEFSNGVIVGESALCPAIVAESKNGTLEDAGQFNKKTIKWGEVKPRSCKRLKLAETPAVDMWPASTGMDGPSMVEDTGENPGSVDINNQRGVVHQEINAECRFICLTSGGSDDLPQDHSYYNNGIGNQQHEHISEVNKTEGRYDENGLATATLKNGVLQESLESNVKDDLACDNMNTEHMRTVKPLYTKLRIKSKGLATKSYYGNSSRRSAVAGDTTGPNNDFSLSSLVSREQNFSCPDDKGASASGYGLKFDDWQNKSEGSEQCGDRSDSKSDKMYSTVYRRSRLNGARKNNVVYSNCEDSTSVSDDDSEEQTDFSPRVDRGCVRRSINTRASKNGFAKNSISKSKYTCGSLEPSTSGRQSYSERLSPSKTSVGLRSTRNRRETYRFTESLDRSRHQQIRKLSWLMLFEHEESYRYIPQMGDEVLYLRQGHEEYVKSSQLHESFPSKSNKNLRSVELCRVEALNYSTLPGSGESCCKLTLKFIDPNSSGCGRSFDVTLPELVTFPDFLVEKTRYYASVERGWTTRDKCQVWWRNENGDGGSWWDGRITAVKAKSQEFAESPWERFVIKYKDGSDEHLHSPWELHEAHIPWEHPHIDVGVRTKLLSSIARLERTIDSNQDSCGVLKLNQAVQKADFINRYPVQFSVDVIKRRLENNYYRTLEAVKHDFEVMLENAQGYFGKKAEMLPKMRKLSDWISKHILSA